MQRLAELPMRASQSDQHCHDTLSISVFPVDTLRRYQWAGRGPAPGQFFVQEQSRGALLTLQLYADPAEVECVFDPVSDSQCLQPTCERAHHDIATALQLKGHGGFLQLHDYWVCEDDWPAEPSVRRELEFEQHLQPHWPSLYYMEWQRPDGTFTKLLRERFSLTRQQRLWFYFELAYALNEALVELGFWHAAISEKTIFYVLDETPRFYRLPDGNEVCC